MAGYSGTPLVKKLGIREGASVAVLHAPRHFADSLGPLPAGARVVDGDAVPLDVAVLFVTERAALATELAALVARLVPAGGLWLAWPKKAARLPADITEDVVREIGLAAGLVDNKVCAIDETWSGLRCVYRLQDRSAVAPRLAAG